MKLLISAQNWQAINLLGKHKLNICHFSAGLCVATLIVFFFTELKVCSLYKLLTFPRGFVIAVLGLEKKSVPDLSQEALEMSLILTLIHMGFFRATIYGGGGSFHPTPL